MPRGLSISLISSTSIGLKKVPTWSARMAITMMVLIVVVVVMTSMMIMIMMMMSMMMMMMVAMMTVTKMIMVTMMRTTMMTMTIKLIITILGIPLLGHAVAPVANCCQAEYGSQVKQDMTLKEFCDYWNKKSGGRSP